MSKRLGIGQGSVVDCGILGSVVDCGILGDDPSDSIRGSNFFLPLQRQLPSKNGLGSREIANLSSFSNLKLCNLVVCFLLLIKRLVQYLYRLHCVRF